MKESQLLSECLNKIKIYLEVFDQRVTHNSYEFWNWQRFLIQLFLIAPLILMYTLLQKKILFYVLSSDTIFAHRLLVPFAMQLHFEID
jgi:hypothetical protein